MLLLPNCLLKRLHLSLSSPTLVTVISMHRSACLYFSLYSRLFTRSNSSQVEHSWPWPLPPPPRGVRTPSVDHVCVTATQHNSAPEYPDPPSLTGSVHVLMILFAKLIRYLQTAFQRWNDRVPILKKQILYPREQGRPSQDRDFSSISAVQRLMQEGIRFKSEVNFSWS